LGPQDGGHGDCEGHLVPRRLRDAAAAVLVLVALFAILMVFAPSVRDHVRQFAGGSSAQWLMPAHVAAGALAVVSTTARGYAADNSYLVFFLIVAGLLFILMLRT
jgi:hypothetical protein